jgi:hypothetical protein
MMGCASRPINSERQARGTGAAHGQAGRGSRHTFRGATVGLNGVERPTPEGAARSGEAALSEDDDSAHAVTRSRAVRSNMRECECS